MVRAIASPLTSWFVTYESGKIRIAKASTVAALLFIVISISTIHTSYGNKELKATKNDLNRQSHDHAACDHESDPESDLHQYSTTQVRRPLAS